MILHRTARQRRTGEVDSQFQLSRRAFCGSLAALSPARASAQTPPNIIYILADDLGWGDLTCYNPASRIRTAALDRLAAEGVRFTDMHSPSAVCTPTRYGTLTGRYCWRSSLKQGVLQGYSPNLIEPGRETIASLLQRAGYETGCIGKWHLGLGDQAKADFNAPLKPSPNDHGFSYSFVLPASLDMPPYLYVENGRATERPTATTPDNGSRWAPAMADRYRHRSNGPWRGMKADIYEAGHRVPFIVRWPGRVKAGTVRNDLACLTDVMATVAGVVDVDMGEHAGEDSFSLLPLLLGKGPSARDHVVHHSAQGLFSLRRGHWKLNFGRGSGGFSKPARIIPKPGEPEGELYNLAEDPAESRNVYLEHPGVVRELTALLEQVKRTGRSWPA